MKGRTLSRLAGLLLVCFVAAPGIARAGEMQTCPMSSSAQGCPMIHKLGRGIGNTLGGWMEVPATIHRYRSASRDSAADFFAGTIVGAGRSVVRTAVGLIEVVTFPLPLNHNTYEPIMSTLDYYDRDKADEAILLR